MSAIKETNFFAGPANGIPYPVGRVERLEDTKASSTPPSSDAARPRRAIPTRRGACGVPERIKAMLPEARFVYLVRDPIARLVSQYQMLVADGRRAQSPWPQALARPRTGIGPPFRTTSPARASTPASSQLYLDRISPGEPAGDRPGGPAPPTAPATLREVFSFLSVDASFTSDELRRGKLFRGGERRVYPPASSRASSNPAPKRLLVFATFRRASATPCAARSSAPCCPRSPDPSLARSCAPAWRRSTAGTSSACAP